MEQLLKALESAMYQEERDIYTLGIARLLDEADPATNCAWCNRDAGRDQGKGSHGICTWHRDQIVAESRARRAQKAA